MPCPLCNDPAGVVAPVAGRDRLYGVECRTCGDFEVGKVNLLTLPARSEMDRWRLSWATRRAWDQGVELRLADDQADKAIESVTEPEPLDKMDLALRHLAGKSSVTGAKVEVDWRHDWPVVLARGEGEFGGLIDALQRSGYAEAVGGPLYVVTPEGWRLLRELKTQRPTSTKAFVAMWFDPAITPAWEEGFRPCLESLGYDPVRVDRQEFLGKIDDYIVAAIRESALLVADFTGHRAGVYCEAGFAHGLGIPVVYTCREGQIEQAHFDTRQYNHIAWDSTADLASKLRARIEATIPTRPSSRR